MANLITMGRIALIIPFCAAFLINAPWNMTAAFAIFTIAAVTDFFDGRIARARKEVSILGATLDPVADKLLIAAALILLTKNGVIFGGHIMAVVIIILREIAVSGLREAICTHGSRLEVTPLAKWKTAAQLIATALFLLAAPTGLVGPSLVPIALGALWLAAILTAWTGGEYMIKAARMLRAPPT